MKILQMVDVPWDSGLAHYALSLSQGLRQKGHTVFVAALPGEKPWSKAKRLGLKTLPLATVKSLASLRRFLKKHSVQLVNAHTGSTHSLAVAACVGQNVAVVRTRADARPLQKKIGASFIYKKTHRVIAAAEYIRNDFLKTFRLNPSHVVTIFQGLPPEEWPQHPLPKEPVLGIVARLDPVKGHRTLLEAAALLKGRVPPFRIRIVGQPENISVHDIEVMIGRLRLDAIVELVGYQKDVSKTMATCSIGVIASTGSEAVSRVAMEWMMSGRPVVSTRVGCLPEVVRDGETGYLVPPSEPEALSAAIAQLLQAPSRISVMGEAGRRIAMQHYSMNTFVDQTERVYEEAIACLR